MKTPLFCNLLIINELMFGCELFYRGDQQNSLKK
jgi:hypothetical protein